MEKISFLFTLSSLLAVANIKSFAAEKIICKVANAIGFLSTEYYNIVFVGRENHFLNKAFANSTDISNYYLHTNPGLSIRGSTIVLLPDIPDESGRWRYDKHRYLSPHKRN